ncbi:hypothetical protein TREES_T100009656 [Tupaia chinensis]|uniref:Uncharacterized protein n=1 Tax=Tupaia chinensis TaxID=246437 RepID=L9LF55_TUPCH|nr:hypothetical protein TREES_T100009656 [Tupaia chinensis]
MVETESRDGLRVTVTTWVNTVSPPPPALVGPRITHQVRWLREEGCQQSSHVTLAKLLTGEPWETSRVAAQVLFVWTRTRFPSFTLGGQTRFCGYRHTAQWQGRPFAALQRLATGRGPVSFQTSE